MTSSEPAAQPPAQSPARAFTRSDDLRAATFRGVDLTGARFSGCDLVDVRVRGSEVNGLEIESPWLIESGGPLVVNGVDVTPLVDAELDRRFPGRALRTASDPRGLREAWEALQRTWAATVARAEAMPAGTVDVSVDGEWTFAQTLRHLVMATDTWLRRTVQGVEQPYHPIGLPDSGSSGSDRIDLSVFTAEQPSFEQVLAVRAERVQQVRDHLATVTADDLVAEHESPWAAGYGESGLQCLHTILEEEWEHHRYAVRDLDAVERRAGSAEA